MRNLRSIYPHLSRNFKFVPQNRRNRSGSDLHLSLVSTRQYCAPSQQKSEKVAAIVDEISGLTLLEVSDLSEVLRQKLGIKEMPNMFVMMPGMGFSVKGGGGPAKVEEKEEKTVFDVKLEGCDQSARIKVIKEVRAITSLGLKEAKDLVEKAPILLKKSVTKEEAENIITKMKEVGAKVSME